MNLPLLHRLAMVALIPAIAIWLGFSPALAQSPPAASTPPPAATPAPGTTPAPSTAPAPPASPAPATPPAAAAPPAASPVQTADPFGEQITLEPKKVVIVKGTANWDSAFDTLIDSFKTLSALLEKQGIKPSGNAMIVYTSTDATGFTYLADTPRLDCCCFYRCRRAASRSGARAVRFSVRNLRHRRGDHIGAAGSGAGRCRRRIGCQDSARGI